MRPSKDSEPVPGYRLINLIGKGSFGEVWLARGPGGTQAALKFVPLHADTGLKELQTLPWIKNIKHPQLMPITGLWLIDSQDQVLEEEVWEHATEEAWLPGTEPATLVVALLVAERTLLDLLREFQDSGAVGIPIQQLLDYAEEAAKGIDFLNEPRHAFGDRLVAIQHRDIKPENLMLIGDSVVIGDFGIARVLDQQSVTATAMIGSPAFMAPECINGEQINRWTDQYSLALSYYYLRCGRLPFPIDSTYFAVINCHVTGALDLSGVEGMELDAVRKGTSLEPRERFDSCRDLVRALRAAVTLIPIEDSERPEPEAIPEPTPEVIEPPAKPPELPPPNPRSFSNNLEKESDKELRSPIDGSPYDTVDEELFPTPEISAAKKRRATGSSIYEATLVDSVPDDIGESPFFGTSISCTPSLEHAAKDYLLLLIEKKVPSPTLQAAWDDFYAVYSNMMFRVFLGRGVPIGRSEDYVREVWAAVASALLTLDGFPTNDGIRSWLLGRIKEFAGKLLVQKLQAATDGLVSTGGGMMREEFFDFIPVPDVWSAALLESVLLAVRQKVTRRNYRVLHMRFVQGIDEIAVSRLLGLSQGEVRVSFDRTLRKLRVGMNLFSGKDLGGDNDRGLGR